MTALHGEMRESAPSFVPVPEARSSKGWGSMNLDTVEGQWTRLRGKILERWGRLTADEVSIVAGRRDQLIGMLQRRYGVARAELERQVEDFERRVLAGR
jgi:Uncharacterized protein conserved in bacteria